MTRKAPRAALHTIFIYINSVIPLQAQHIELDLYGLSYNLIGSGYEEAPRKLNDNGAWVFNPGIGITYDFRSTFTENGWSAIGLTGYFKDCDDQPYYFYHLLFLKLGKRLKESRFQLLWQLS